MRKYIIDTDTGSDDAVALIMALRNKHAQIMAITTVAGNCNLDQATLNALMTIEVTQGHQPSVYKGAAKPLFKDLFTAEGVHGQDGMGDMDLIHPSLKPSKEHAVDKILELVEANPGEIDIITIGPLTNIGLAILKAPEVMKQVKHIYSMGTGGFGKGNVTPVAEFNVYVDAEAYDIFLNFDVPKTIIGFDLCLGETALNLEDIESLKKANTILSNYVVDINTVIRQYNLKSHNLDFADVPDAVAMAVAMYPEVVIEEKNCFCHTVTKEPYAYGQVIVDDFSIVNVNETFSSHKANAKVVKKLDNKLFKKFLMESIL